MYRLTYKQLDSNYWNLQQIIYSSKQEAEKEAKILFEKKYIEEIRIIEEVSLITRCKEIVIKNI